MESEKYNKQNEILSKAKESIYKFQKQFNNYLENNKSPINTIDENNMTFNPKKHLNKNKELFIDKEVKKEKNNFNKIEDNEDYTTNQNYFIDNDDNEKNNYIKTENNDIFEGKKLYNNNNNEKIFKDILEENYVLKTEINKLIDENKSLGKELNKKEKNPIKKERYKDNNIKNDENDLVLKKNKELSKLVKELNNRNRIQKQRNQDIEQILKDKNNYITQMEQKLKDINSNNDKNNLYKTKYNQLLTRFDLINKELTALKKSKSNNDELIIENKKLKQDLNNLLKKDLENNDINKVESSEYKKNYKKLLDENKELKEKIEKLKKEKIILKNTNYKALKVNEPQKEESKIITELKFENNSLKDICSEMQNKNKELNVKINDLQKKYLEDIDIIQKEIINFKEKESIEKNELKNQILLLRDNPVSNNSHEIIDLRNQVNNLLRYKNKVASLEEKNFQLKVELRKYKQENGKKFTNNKNNYDISNHQSLFFKSNNNIMKSNKEKDKRENNETYVEMNKKIGDLMKKNEDLSKENDKLNTKKNELIQQVNNLNDLIDLNNKDLVNKILELEKVIEVLNKELNLENDKKLVLENKIMKLEKNINRQIDEVSEREEMSIRKDSQKDNFENKETSKFSIDKEQEDKIENFITQISLLKNENSSLIKTINNLKNEIRIYKIKLNPSKKTKEKDKALKDDQDLIKDITEEMNKWKKEYYNLTKVNDILKSKLSNYEKNLGIDEEIKYLKDSLYKKDKLLMDLTLQIKEYQSKSDDIILGKTNKNKEKQIEILLNEVKGIRKRLLNIVTLNERINNFDDFIANIELIQKLGNKIKDKEAKKALENLKFFIDEYKLNNDMAYNQFLVKLYST